MTEELFNELKEAGFPVRKDVFAQYVPDLSELIEASNLSRFNHFELECINTMKVPGQWLARVGTNDWTHITEWFSTPTEAVARLWLALNKKV